MPSTEVKHLIVLAAPAVSNELQERSREEAHVHASFRCRLRKVSLPEGCYCMAVGAKHNVKQ